MTDVKAPDKDEFEIVELEPDPPALLQGCSSGDIHVLVHDIPGVVEVDLPQ